GIGVAHRHHQHAAQVARRQHQVLVHVVVRGDDEQLLEAQRLHLLHQQLSLGRVELELAHHPQPILARELRQDRGHAGAVHLAVHFLAEVLVGRVGEDLAAAAPQRARGHPGARASGALLPPRLLGGVVHRAAVLLRARADARVRLVRDHELVHQRLVEVAREDVVGRLHGAGGAVAADHLEFHRSTLRRCGFGRGFRRLRRGGFCGLRSWPRRRLRRGLGRLRLDRRSLAFHGETHEHVAAARARDRALDEKKLARLVDAHDLKIRDGPTHVAEMAWHALALEDVRRALVLAGGAGNPMRDRVAVRCVLPAEMMPLDDPGEALADRHALHVDELADLEELLRRDLRAHLELAELLGLPEPELPQHVPGLDRRPGEMAGERLVDAGRSALAERDLHRGIAVLLGGLDLGDAVVGEDASHADLAADQTYRHTFLFWFDPPGFSRWAPASIGRHYPRTTC